ncbi:MAG: hypothetical protein HOH58_18400 [Opitutaceae bacterium]|nr:hypothetical protein [Opitutaceae bacterium]
MKGCWKTILGCVALCAGSMVVPAGGIDLGDRRELFVDHELIESMEGVSLRLHEPRNAGPAFYFDKPWEGKFSAGPTVLNDNGLYRMYYRGLPRADDETEAVTAYAESRDGVNWVKPNLGLFEVEGTKDNNVVVAVNKHCRSFSPFIDTRPGVPASERYKAIAGVETKGLLAFVSSDGIHWKLWREGYIFTEGMFDSHNVLFWSDHEEAYVCYFRTWTGEGFGGFRTISRTTSPDMLNWSKPVAMSFGDTPMEHLYTNGTFPYYRAPHIYIGLAKRFFPEKAAASVEQTQALIQNSERGYDSSDAVLMTTRGGGSYDRTFMEAFIRPGDTLADWIGRDNTPGLGLVPAANGRELYIYRLSHYAQDTSHLSRYVLRVDGFVSVHAPYDGGELLTKPFRFSGEQLVLNFESSAAGEIRIELRDAAGEPIEGFTVADCALIFGNEIDGEVNWTGGRDLSELAGQEVQMRIEMKDADLYSFQFR